MKTHCSQIPCLCLQTYYCGTRPLGGRRQHTPGVQCSASVGTDPTVPFPPLCKYIQRVLILPRCTLISCCWSSFCPALVTKTWCFQHCQVSPLVDFTFIPLSAGLQRGGDSGAGRPEFGGAAGSGRAQRVGGAAGAGAGDALGAAAQRRPAERG